jgi:hypothetical protein
MPTEETADSRIYHLEIHTVFQFFGQRNITMKIVRMKAVPRAMQYKIPSYMILAAVVHWTATVAKKRFRLE